MPSELFQRGFSCSGSITSVLMVPRLHSGSRGANKDCLESSAQAHAYKRQPHCSWERQVSKAATTGLSWGPASSL